MLHEEFELFWSTWWPLNKDTFKCNGAEILHKKIMFKFWKHGYHTGVIAQLSEDEVEVNENIL